VPIGEASLVVSTTFGTGSPIQDVAGIIKRKVAVRPEYWPVSYVNDCAKTGRGAVLESVDLQGVPYVHASASLRLSTQ
jgi:hypothetical protein